MERKKKKLFERSEFFFFSGVQHNFSKIHAALTFWFFCVKAKEQKKVKPSKKLKSRAKQRLPAPKHHQNKRQRTGPASWILRKEIMRNGALKRKSCLSEASSFSLAECSIILAKYVQP
jgi:hypothetical protein